MKTDNTDGIKSVYLDFSDFALRISSAPSLSGNDFGQERFRFDIFDSQPTYQKIPIHNVCWAEPNNKTLVLAANTSKDAFGKAMVELGEAILESSKKENNEH